jgi:hypothetical protein
LALACLETEQCVATGRQDAEELGEEPGEFLRRHMDDRVSGKDPAQLPVEERKIRQLGDPKLRSGEVPRATAIIPADTSFPDAFALKDASSRVMRPVPQPASSAGPRVPSVTWVTKASIMPRSSGASKLASGSRRA